ncbi:MAG: PIG-L family deacetylase [bacterium]|nr:PIG-L family deacetylase [bacterium]
MHAEIVAKLRENEKSLGYTNQAEFGKLSLTRDMLEIKDDALVVVAHPDDETIWMGGTILGNKNCDWTIISLCRGDDKDRAPKFRGVCKKYGAKAVISDLEDEGIMNIKDSVPQIQKRLKKLLKKTSFGYIFTHSPTGEYGHPRHKGVNRAVRALINQGYLKAQKVLIFDYPLDERKNHSVPSKRAGVKINLPSKVFKAKQDLIQKVYGFSKNSFEYKSSSKVEAFNLAR